MFIHIIDTFGDDCWVNTEQITSIIRDKDDNKTSIFLTYNSKLDYLRTNESIEAVMEKIK